MTVTEEMAARYLAVSHEPDPPAREAAVAALWTARARMCTAANDYAGGDAVSGGTQFLLLDADGHIRFDYQFTDF